MEKYIHINRNNGKWRGVLMFNMFLAFFLFQSNAFSQASSQVLNDGGINLKIWLEGVWTDANCNETLDPLSGKVKYVFEGLEVRASRGNSYAKHNFPEAEMLQFLLLQYFPIQMTFTIDDVKNKQVGSFWRPTDSKFSMLNPWYPFRRGHMHMGFPPNHQVVVQANRSKYPPPVLGDRYNPVALGENEIGLDASNGNSFLLFDHNFSNEQAPDRFEYKINGMWESDADADGKEAGIVVCNAVYGLPQVAELRRLKASDLISFDLDKILNSYDVKLNPFLGILLLDGQGMNIFEYLIRVGGCSDIFGINLNPDNFFGLAISFVATDFDDSWTEKQSFSGDEAFIRATPPGQKGYFGTQKIEAQKNRDKSGEGYFALFSYEWNWNTPNYPELGAEPGMPVRVQAPMCPDEVYTDAHVSAPIKVEAWIEGLFQDNDHEGYEHITNVDFGLFSMDLDLGFAGCTDINLPKMDRLLGGTEEIRLRGKGWVSQQSESEPGWNATLKWNQDRPGWRKGLSSLSGAKLIDKTYTTEAGVRSFDIRLEAWESDCDTEAPVLSGNCGKKCVAALSNRCCIANMPFSSSKCLIPGFKSSTDDRDQHAVTSPIKINYRNSPPNTMNYQDIPIGGLGDPGKNYVARIRYRWTLEKPQVVLTNPPFDIISCPGETHELKVSDVKGATFYQWQYVEVDGPAGPVCPNIPDDEWIDVANAICPEYTTPANFPTTRIYRLKVFNRAGSGSVSSSGDKFAYAYSQCIRIQKLPQPVPIVSNIGCGTSAEPVTVRTGSTGKFAPVLPPDSGSLDVPGIKYDWTVNNGATVSPNQGESVTVTFPSQAGRVVRVGMGTNLEDVCGAILARNNYCYFITQDGGCDTLTGTLYVSPTAVATGIGTISNPYNIAAAFKALRDDSRLKHVKLLEGNYTVASGTNWNQTDSALIITDSLVVDGGYVVRTAADGSEVWVKKSDAKSTITSNIVERINDSTIHKIGFRAVGVKDWVLQDVTIIMGNAVNRTPTNYGYGPGLSNYGVLVANATGYTLQNVHIEAGSAGNGSIGETPAYNDPPDVINVDLGQPGANGTSAGPGDVDVNYAAPIYGIINLPSQRRPGRGGDINRLPDHVNAPQGILGDGQSSYFNTGGQPGRGGLYGNGDPALRNGQQGANGGSPSSPPTAIQLSDLDDMSPYFVPRARSVQRGEDGQGGGGGASNGGSNHGGSGGIGGRGGLPGYGGGGAFGLWVVGASSGLHNNITVDDTNIGVGGLGGTGGLGEFGQEGGAGHGSGYKGGNGGRGGRGPSGGQGFRWAEYVANSTSTTGPTGGIDPQATYVESDYGSGCTNSVFTIEKFGTTSNWSGFGSAVHDITETKGSTDATNANKKLVYYPNDAFPGKTLTTGDGNYRNQIYVRFQREKPEIEDLPGRICSGELINLNADPKSEMHTEYRWTIQEGTTSSIISATNPAPVLTYNTLNVNGVQLPANTTTNPIDYQIKFEVKDACCGWSIPVYKYIRVLPEYLNVIGVGDDPNIDTVYICNEGSIPQLRNRIGVPQIGQRPPSAIYEWFVSKDGGPYQIMAGETQESLSAQSYSGTGDNGTYRYVRLVKSSNPDIYCLDTSNVITVIVTDNITDNVIAAPGLTTCGANGFPKSSNAVQTTGQYAINIGYMSGNVPAGPGGTISYQWQYGTMNITTNEIEYTNYPNSGPTEGGNGPQTQSFDPGLGTTSVTYGAGSRVFHRDSLDGEVFFRRIAFLDIDVNACKDTSNHVIAYIPRGAERWGDCPTPSGTGTFPLCQTYVQGQAGVEVKDLVTTNIAGQGLCLVEAPDTVCFGEYVNITVPNSMINGQRGQGAVYAWYMVVGGPFNNITTSPPVLNFCNTTTDRCTNPMKNDFCSNDKPIPANPADLDSVVVFLGTTNATRDTLGFLSGSSMPHLMLETATFYVNLFDECFSDAQFRASGPSYNYPGPNHSKWQRKTIVVREPILMPDTLIATPDRYCSDDMPATIELEIGGGLLGNTGRYQIFENDTTNESNIIYTSEMGAFEDSIFVVDPAPSMNTTYYARIVNDTCDTTNFVRVDVIVDVASEVPLSLDGPATICLDESATLTVQGGSLGDNAMWALYRNSVTPANRIDYNTTGSFTVTPNTVGNHTYIVRGEYDFVEITCDPTDTVQLTIEVRDDCVCDVTPGTIEYAPYNTTTIATVECEDSNGWTYYADPLKPEEYLFAIQKRPSDIPNGNTTDFNARVSITVVEDPRVLADVFYNDDGSCEANFVMGRYWNVDYVGAARPDAGSFVRVRFYFPQEELNTTIARATQWKDNESSCAEPLAVGPPQVFKTYGANFNPNSPKGYSPAGHIQPTTINNFNYVGHLLSSLPHSDTYPQTEGGKNYVQVAWDGFSGGGISVRVSPDLEVLPITLVSFTGSWLEDEVLLSWETASELNNDHFVVERSTDAKNWKAIGSVKGNGTTSEPHHYSLIDAHPVQGDNYYRLKQVDYDGAYEYSRIILLSVDKASADEQTFSVQPNPTSGPVTATIFSDTDQQVNLRILDMRGRVIGNKDVTLGAGYNNVKVDLSHYPAATYILSFTDRDGTEYNAKVVKQ